MSTPSKDPLDALQSLIDDVLIHTGKALRSSRKDSHGRPRPPDPVQPKIPETIRRWHCALDELEFDILKAKAVLLRDLHQVQERKRLFANNPEPLPQDPITIDLVSPTSSTIKHEPDVPPAAAAPKPLMAPFPNMSIDLPNQADAAVKSPAVHPPPPPPPQTTTITTSSSTTTTTTTTAPSASADVPRPLALASPHPNLKPGAPAPPSGMTFTNMEFSLAPPLSNDPPEPTGTATATATAFAPPPSFTPADTNSKKRPGLAPPYQDTTTTTTTNLVPSPQEKVEDKNGGAGVAGSSQFQDLFGNDSGAADGMDFDFSLGGGEESFDALVTGRNDGTVPPAAGGNNLNVSNGGNMSGGSGSGSGSGGGMSSAEFDAMMMNLDKPAEP